MTYRNGIKTLVLVLGGWLSSSSAQYTNHCAENPSAARPRPGPSPTVPSNLLQGIIDLGRFSSVCMGIELIDSSLVERGMPKTSENAGSVEAAVKSLLANVPEYCAELRGKILSVRPCNRTEDTWLDFRLRRFAPHAEQLQSMSFVLYSWLSAEINPAKSTMGHFRSGDPNDTVGPYDESDVTVRMLLDQFVSDSHGALWITVRPYGRRAHGIEPDQFWRIAEYRSESLVLSVVPQVQSGFSNAER